MGALRIGLLGLLLVACATNPATGKRELSLVSQADEIKMGKEAAAQTIASVGLVKDDALQAYVSQLGHQLAASTERPNLPWEFHVVDDPSVNAFALPGGFVFVTRGLLAHLNNEAELATVMGHEIGHVTARHSVHQQSEQELAQLGLGIGAILSPTVARYGQLATAGMQLLFLKYSRDDESQADELGFRYALKDGYDVRTMADVFTMLGQVSGTSGGRLPQWLSTHPDPQNRVQATKARLAQTHVDWSTLKRDPQPLLPHVEGLVYGEDPRHGYFKGNTFIDPELRFQFDLPAGWKTSNEPSAVGAVSPQKDAIIALQPAGTEAPEVQLKKFLSQEGLVPGTPSAGNLNGMPTALSAFQANTDQGPVAGAVTFLSYEGHTYGLLSYAGAQQFPQYEALYKQTLESFRPLTDPAALAVQPARIKLETLTKPTTVAELAQRSPAVSKEELALLNRVSPDATLEAGRVVKLVAGAPPPK